MYKALSFFNGVFNVALITAMACNSVNHDGVIVTALTLFLFYATVVLVEMASESGQ